MRAFWLAAIAAIAAAPLLPAGVRADDDRVDVSLRPALVLGGGAGVAPLGGLPAFTGFGFAGGGLRTGPWLFAGAFEGWATTRRPALGPDEASLTRLSAQVLLGRSLGPWTVLLHGGAGRLVTERDFGRMTELVPVLGAEVAFGVVAAGLVWSGGREHCGTAGPVACREGAGGLEARVQLALDPLALSHWFRASP